MNHTAKAIALVVPMLLIASPEAFAQKFSFTFEWGDIPSCNTGSPNVVPNPIFKLKNVPKGTKFIEFQMNDLDAPSYSHGGGTVPYSGEDVIKPGGFTYESPCPPGRVHTYEWTANTKEEDGFFSSSTAEATAKRKYPE